MGSGIMPEGNQGAEAAALRVLMVNYEFPPIGGGTGRACAQVLAEFATRRDINIDLVTSSTDAGIRVASLANNITIHYLPITKQDLQYWKVGEIVAWTRQALPYAARLVRQRHYDCCHSWAGWPSGIVGHWLGLPHIVALRGSDVPGYNQRLRKLDPLLMALIARRIWSQATRVVAVSRNLRHLALQTRPGTEIDVIPNGVDVQRFRPGSAKNFRRILSVGRLIERKGVDYLLQAFQGVLAVVPDAELLIVGEGPERVHLEAKAKALQLSGVGFLGHLEGDALSSAYSRSAILALPALADAMPNVVLEAMAAGLAIVTTPTGGSEILRGNGIVVPTADADALCSALIGYLTDPIRLAEHQRISRQLAEDMSWAAVADCYLQLYRDVAASAQFASQMPARECHFSVR